MPTNSYSLRCTALGALLSVCTVSFAAPQPWIEVRSSHFIVVTNSNEHHARQGRADEAISEAKLAVQMATTDADRSAASGALETAQKFQAAQTKDKESQEAAGSAASPVKTPNPSAAAKQTTTASAEGGVQILSDTLGVDFDPYLKRVVPIVNENWHTLLPEEVFPPIRKSGTVSIEFTIMKDGQVAGMKLASSSGDPLLERASWGSVTYSAPFQALPQEFKGQFIQLRFVFCYNDACKSAPAPSVNSQAAPAASAPGTSDLIEAATLYRNGKLDEAAQRFQHLLEMQPKSAEAYAGLTRVYLKQKNVQQAHETIATGLAIADSPTVRVALGEVLFREGKLPAAESEWLAVINSGHADARAYLGLARVSTATTLYKQAKSEIDKAHALDSSDPDIQLYWIRSLVPSEQVTYLEDYLSHESNDSAEERTRLRNYLEYLKARQKDLGHSCRLATKLTATQVDLFRLSGERPNQTRGYGLAVALDGQKSKLQLDTGASGILIDRRIAQKAGLTRISDTTLEGLGDTKGTKAYLAMARSIKVGDLEFLDCPVAVVEKRSVLGLDGFIGTDVFQAFLIDLDFSSRKLGLAELPTRPDEIPMPIGLQVGSHPSDFGGRLQSGLPAAAPDEPANFDHADSRERYIPPDMKSYTPVYRFGHALLIPTMVGKDPARLFLIDTGGFMNMISVTTAREVTKVHEDSLGIKGLSGTVNKMYSADEIKLQFGKVRYGISNEATLDLAPMSNQIGTELSGVLGSAAFLQLDVRIDYRDGLVDFEEAGRVQKFNPDR